MDERRLVRLVTQFDRPDAQPAYATPTCGCSSCCCCSCCVGTAVASLSFTAMNVYFVAQEEERSRLWRWVATALATLALPLGVLAGYLAGGSVGAYAAAGVPTWLVLVAAAYLIAGRQLAGALGRTVAIALVGGVAGGVELFVGAVVQDGVGYFVFGAIIGLGAAGIGYRVAREW